MPTFTRGRHRVEFEDIGEGLSGDYDPTDPDDQPLLRFTTERRNDAGEWEEVPDGSYCTLLPTDTAHEALARAAEPILDALEQPSPKRRLEELSWLQSSDLEPAPPSAQGAHYP